MTTHLINPPMSRAIRTSTATCDKHYCRTHDDDVRDAVHRATIELLQENPEWSRQRASDRALIEVEKGARK